MNCSRRGAPDAPGKPRGGQGGLLASRAPDARATGPEGGQVIGRRAAMAALIWGRGPKTSLTRVDASGWMLGVVGVLRTSIKLLGSTVASGAPAWRLSVASSGLFGGVSGASGPAWSAARQWRAMSVPPEAAAGSVWAPVDKGPF
eukprot:4478153-Pyramimonas_sp.AAC.1